MEKLKKVIAGKYKFKRDEAGNIISREWIPQKEIELGPEEEAMTRAEWAYNEECAKLPEEISDSQKLAWLLDNGAEYVKQKEAERVAQIQRLTPGIEAKKKVLEEKRQVFLNSRNNG